MSVSSRMVRLLDEAALPPENKTVVDALVAALKKRPEFTSVKQRQGNKISVEVSPDASPMVASVEFWDMDRPVGKWKYVLHDGQNGWGWNEVPAVQKFTEPNNTLKFAVVVKNAAQLGMKSVVDDFVSLNVVYGLKKTGMVWGATPSDLVPQSAWKAKQQAAATPKPAAPKSSPKDGISPVEDVISALKGKKTKTGGRLKLHDKSEYDVTFEPENRARLDHYGTSYDDDDNEQEGWDEDGWSEDYSGPLIDEIESLLKNAGVTGWIVDIGDKGFVDLARAR